jgi:hypothetical protein
MTKKTKKYPKLSRRARDLSRKTVGEEIETDKYPRRQAVAVGLSRARDQAHHEHAMATAREYL